MPQINITGNPTQTDMINANMALSYLSHSPTLLAALESGAPIYIGVNYANNDVTSRMTDSVSGIQTSFISWDPTAAHQVTAGDNSIGVQSPAMAMAHEIAHAVYGANENEATAFEQTVAHELGEPVRKNYTSVSQTPIIVTNPTEHTTDDQQWVQTNVDGTKSVLGTYTQGSTTPPNAGWGGSSGGAPNFFGFEASDGVDFSLYPYDGSHGSDDGGKWIFPPYQRLHPSHPEHPSHPDSSPTEHQVIIVGTPEPVHG